MGATFYTGSKVKNDFLMIKIDEYEKMKIKNPELLQSKKIIFIDPGVYDLVKDEEYTFFKKNPDFPIIEWLKTLPKNHYFTWDYPCDMNPKFTDLFLQKSWENALKYHEYEQYIVTVQSKFHDYMSFVEWFDKYNNLEIASGILGLGNICRIFFKDNYIKHALPYAFKNCKHPWIHVYGLAMRNIPFACSLAKKYKKKISIDSVKWTRASTNELKEKHGLNCSTHTRQEFFDEYLKLIKTKGVKLENE